MNEIISPRVDVQVGYSVFGSSALFEGVPVIYDLYPDCLKLTSRIKASQLQGIYKYLKTDA